MATRFTLPNGLRVVHEQDSATAMVALDVLYNVAARATSIPTIPAWLIFSST